MLLIPCFSHTVFWNAIGFTQSQLIFISYFLLFQLGLYAG